MNNETHNTNPVKTKPRRWFRFRLRTLLIMVMFLSVPLGWVGWELDQRRREKSVVRWVEEMGGQVYFHSGNQTGSFPLVISDERSWWGQTKENWLGERVRVVLLDNTQVIDLSPLAELKNVEVLFLNNTPVSDEPPLAELKNLKWLGLSGTQVNDLSPLAELKKLEMIFLHDTSVSEQQLQDLRLALPNCKIHLLDY